MPLFIGGCHMTEFTPLLKKKLGISKVRFKNRTLFKTKRPLQSRRKAEAKSETAHKHSFSIHYQFIKLILQAKT